MPAGKTISEKILSEKSGRDASAGDVVVCDVDCALGTDGSTPMALDYFDAMATGNDLPGLHIVGEDGTECLRSFSELSSNSNRVANHLREIGARRGDRLLLMLGNEVALWETLLAAMKLGVVVIPATALLTCDDLQDRIDRGRVRHVVAAGPQARKFESVRGEFTRTIVNGDLPGWRRYEESREADAQFVPDGETLAADPLLLYFTSGTTAKPKLVLHTHESYPVGHLSTLYWIGLQPGDRQRGVRRQRLQCSSASNWT